MDKWFLVDGRRREQLRKEERKERRGLRVRRHVTFKHSSARKALPLPLDAPPGYAWSIYMRFGAGVEGKGRFGAEGASGNGEGGTRRRVFSRCESRESEFSTFSEYEEYMDE